MCVCVCGGPGFSVCFCVGPHYIFIIVCFLLCVLVNGENVQRDPEDKRMGNKNL